MGVEEVDVIEQILIRLDVEDLIRCKSVCKSWQSLISSPFFVKSHLKHAYKSDGENHELGHRRLVCDLAYSEAVRFDFNEDHIVGSCNGLVCFSPIDVKILVTNPSTRQVKKLPTPPYRHQIAMIRDVVCWGSGYDSCADDYKVIAGFRKNEDQMWTLFYALTLKSNTWKVIGKVKYRDDFHDKSGTLCGGALHWFMCDTNNKTVIVSLDLSTDKFKEIPHPIVEYGYDCNHRNKLGVIEKCLCIVSFTYPSTTKIWVMKNNNTWIDHHDYCCRTRSKFDVVHCLIKTSNGRYGHDGGTHVPSDGGYISDSIFVKSLVSPHDKGQEDNESHAKGKIRKRKKRSL